MTSKRAVRNRIKDFDVLLNEYLQSHPPKTNPKTLSAAVNLDLLTTNDDDSADAEAICFHDISPLKHKRNDNLYLSMNRRNIITKYRTIFSFLDRDRSNKIPRTL